MDPRSKDLQSFRTTFWSQDFRPLTFVFFNLTIESDYPSRSYWQRANDGGISVPFSCSWKNRSWVRVDAGSEKSKAILRASGPAHGSQACSVVGRRSRAIWKNIGKRASRWRKQITPGSQFHGVCSEFELTRLARTLPSSGSTNRWFALTRFHWSEPDAKLVKPERS